MAQAQNRHFWDPGPGELGHQQVVPNRRSEQIGLIKELGPEAYLRNLLSILKGNYPRS